ncbi:MAG: dephospho-CoA kinase [Bdellovibrionales bacterium]|nr:dephospho-CoA kinase [Bdellovibrionales bacterium]
MIWIGLTGGIATGKSTVSNLLREMGYPVVDADALAHKSLEKDSECYKQVVKIFGSSILDENLQIDRKKLGKIVFSNKVDLTKLENIIHPYVQKMALEIRREYESTGHKLAFYDVPLLFEKELQGNFDKTMLVYAPIDLQKERIINRDKLTDQDVDLRIAAQIPIDDKKTMADIIIENTGSLADLKQELNKKLKEFL